jgi:hypothetical protein
MPIPYAAWTSGTARSRRQFRSLLLPLKAIIRNEPAESRLGDQELVEDLAGARRRADGRTWRSPRRAPSFRTVQASSHEAAGWVSSKNWTSSGLGSSKAGSIPEIVPARPVAPCVATSPSASTGSTTERPLSGAFPASRRRDSNPRPSDYKSLALPAELLRRSRRMVALGQSRTWRERWCWSTFRFTRWSALSIVFVSQPSSSAMSS